ncbi:MAG: GntR family transcriptional regulator [Deltaproteobacteria bacterium]|nr:GntR family transcriptional regulator [Deltaproteobacteria bacterium]
MSSINSLRIVKELESDILSGHIKPRERLIEMDLISRFGVSRTVIREVLKSLESKGIVKATPYRGVMVADLTMEEIDEIYFLRIELEKIAARLVLKHITGKEVNHLKILLKEVERHLRKQTPQMIEADSEFHRMIFKACHNRYLYEVIDYLRTRAHIVRYNAWSIPHRIEQSILEHRQMMKSIENRDLSQLERLVVKHLTFSKHSYMSQLKGGGLREKATLSFPKTI